MAGPTGGKKIIHLRLTVPADVQVITQLVPSTQSIEAAAGAGGKSLSGRSSTMKVDLTSAKTSEWLRKKALSDADCSNCCCVRG